MPYTMLPHLDFCSNCSYFTKPLLPCNLLSKSITEGKCLTGNLNFLELQMHIQVVQCKYTSKPIPATEQEHPLSLRAYIPLAF